MYLRVRVFIFYFNSKDEDGSNAKICLELEDTFNSFKNESDIFDLYDHLDVLIWIVRRRIEAKNQKIIE